MPGRKKTPTHLKVLKGTAQRCRLNPNEPIIKVVKLKCPDYLDPQAKRTFKKLAILLQEMEISAVSDQQALAMLSDMYSIYRKMLSLLQNVGFTYETTSASGDIMIRPRPEVAILTEAWKNTRSMMAEFGLTPSSRSKVSTPGINQQNLLAEFIAKRKNG